MSSIDEYLDEALAPEDAPSPDVIRGYMAAMQSPPDSEERAEAESRPPWRIDSEGAADWAARKIQRAARILQDKQDQYDRQQAALDQWLESEARELQSDIDFFEGMLGDWLRREIAADDSKKPKVSRKLPCGATVKRTPAGESLQVDDEEALVAFLAGQEDTAELVEFVPKYSKADVKRLVTRDGVKVPGVHIELGVHGWKVTL